MPENTQHGTKQLEPLYKSSVAPSARTVQDRCRDWRVRGVMEEKSALNWALGGRKGNCRNESSVQINLKDVQDLHDPCP